jgi:hypothetical protein
MRSTLTIWSVRAFYLCALWATATAVHLHRAYQDAWVLDDLWLPLAATVVCYLLSVLLSTDLRQIAGLTSIATGLMHGVPALKYANVYLSTIDNTVHVSLLRMIATTGHVEGDSSYASTPGFHALAAAVAQIGGIAPSSIAQVAPSFVGCIGPLAFYVLCKRFPFPPELAKIVIILSGFSLPALYTLSGTNFVMPLLISLIVVFFIVRIEPSRADQVSYRLLMFLFMITIVFWHPGTSIILPGILMLVGVAATSLYRGTMFPNLSKDFRSIAWFGGVAVLAFWMFSAEFVWQRFALNVITALTADSKTLLIPNRLFEIGLTYQLLIAAFNHSRDLAIVGLGMLGVVFLLFMRRSTQLSQFFRAYALIWAAFVGLLLAVFVASFGEQGYTRFLGYVIGLSPILAGYGLWRIIQWVQQHVPVVRAGATAAVAFVLVAGMFSVQMYPYQPAIPTLRGDQAQNVPIVWLHQVNSTYQEHMIRWTFRRLMPTVSLDRTQVLADYISYQQGALYYNIQAKKRLRRSIDQAQLPAYVLLHWPGKAGAFMEQAEYRSNVAIRRWYDGPDTSVVYDNGASFVLFSPTNAEEPFYLER